MRAVAQMAIRGLADPLTILTEQDEDVMLVMEAVNAAAAEQVQDDHKALASHIIATLGKAMERK